MKWLLVCALCLLTVSQVRSFYVTRIVNGTDAKLGEIPFQVSLRDLSSGKSRHFCGGSVLNENYVVTAAHCVYGRQDEEDSKKMRVEVGSIYLDKPYQTHKVQKVIVHKGFNPSKSLKNDVALIKVTKPFVFSDRVQPVPLPELHTKILANSKATVSGWGGRGGEIQGLPNTLQKATIRIADQEYCKKVMVQENEEIFPTQICANDPTMRKGQCNGDSGGPLIVNGKLTGIVSWSVKDPYCASTIYPGVYTRVPEFVDWILEHAK
ncbi:hypothetical protein TKK_0015152 [Trichogramma kaykai]|uniref:chymotrypsin n=1 Tax=Trichogramma kaykai TaxID=54128 RepID=A0ABD2WAT0_9HYME